MPNCLVISCQSQVNRYPSSGMCDMHAQRVERHGAITEPHRKMPLYKKFLMHVNDTGECWEWMGVKNATGYGRLYHKSKPIAAHRYSYSIYNGLIKDGQLIRHTCDNPSCVNPEHLISGSNMDNSRDMKDRGRGIRGEKVSASKLKKADIPVIIKKRKQGVKLTELAKEFGVSAETIKHVVKRKTWKHVAIEGVEK